MLEAGLVRTKNVTAVLTVNIMVYAIASLTLRIRTDEENEDAL